MFDWLDIAIGWAFAGLMALFLLGGVIDLGRTWWQESGTVSCGRVEWFGRKILYLMTIVVIFTVPPLMGAGFIETVFGVTKWWALFLAAGLGGGLFWLVGTHPILEQWIRFLKRES